MWHLEAAGLCWCQDRAWLFGAGGGTNASLGCCISKTYLCYCVLLCR